MRSAFASLWKSFGGSLPFVTVIALAQRTADEEALVEDLAHVPHLAQVLQHVARAQLVVVRVERADAVGDSPRWSDRNAASAAMIPDSIA